MSNGTERIVTYHHKPRALLSIFNKAGEIPLLNGVLAPQLSSDRIIESAIKMAGCNDFGGDDFLEPLAILVDCLNGEAELNATGRALSARFLASDLANRLRLVRALRENPDIEKTKVSPPVCIIGMPRTGTTILHELMCQDERFRYLATWESDTPFPHPEKLTYKTDPRIAQVDKKYSMIGYLADGVEAIHEMGATLPQECIVIQGVSLRSQSYFNSYYVPTYIDWLSKSDMRISYRWHKKMLQYLQYRYAAQYWILKSPNQIGYVDQFLDVYPDAQFIQTHRPLFNVMPSISSLTAKLRGSYTYNNDPVRIGKEMLNMFGDALNRLVELRSNRPDIDAKIIDIDYQETLESPAASVEKICNFIGIGMPDSQKLAVSNYLKNKPQHHKGKHVYKAEWFGIDKAMIESRFGRYHSKYVK